MYTLYQIKFPNTKIYIGVTGGFLQTRFEQHKKYAFSSKSNYILAHAIRKYGKNNIVIEALAIGNREYIYDLETKAIAAFRSMDPEYGYNSTAGGKGGIKGYKKKPPSDETRKRMSLSKMGKTTSQETKEKLSKQNGCLITAFGETHTIKDWSKIKKINYKTLLMRIRVKRWPIEKALTTSTDVNRYIKAFGEIKSIGDWSKVTGLSKENIRSRIDYLGWSPEQALDLYMNTVSPKP